MSRRPGLKTFKNTEDTIKNDKEDKDGIPIGGIPCPLRKVKSSWSGILPGQEDF